MKKHEKNYQPIMADLNRYISAMSGKDGWRKEILISPKDYDILIKNEKATKLSHGTAIYRGEFFLKVKE